MTASDCFSFALARPIAAAQPAQRLGAAVAKRSLRTLAGVRDGLHASAGVSHLSRAFALSANL